VCYPDKLSPAGEASQNLTTNQTQSSLQYDPGNRRVIREASGSLVKWYSANYRLDPTDRNYLKTIVENLLEIASLRQSASPHGSQKINGNPTKRIVRILTTKSAAGSHLTYEKELLNSRKNSNFYKTNHPGSPHGLPPYDPNNNIFRIYAQSDRWILVKAPHNSRLT